MKAKQVLNHLQITRQTLTKYVKDGKIRVEIGHNKQYSYNQNDVFKSNNE